MKKIKKHKFLIMIVTVISFLCIFGFTYGKYVSNSIWNYYLESKGFYFSSDYLGTTESKNVDNLWDGESVAFNIKNSVNQNVITGYDIGYNVSCEIQGDAASHAECHLNGTNLSTQTGVLTSIGACQNKSNDNVDVSSYNKTNCELGNYNWLYQAATNNLYFDIVLTDQQYTLKDVSVNITATSSTPYQKTLIGNFTLHKSNATSDAVTLDYKSYSNYERLTIANSYANTKCVKLTWNSSNLLIDTNSTGISSSNVDENDYINEIKFNISKKTSLSYIFYKRHFSETYNVNDFTIEETTGC